MVNCQGPAGRIQWIHPASMTSAPLETERGSWCAAGQPLKIEYPLSVLEEICAAAVDGLYRFRHGGMEVGGVLFGVHENATVRIVAARPLECDHAYGPRFVLSDGD